MEPETICGILALMIPIIALSIPIVAILVRPLSEGRKIAERTAARKLYERLALEKLDVLKTAVAMGYTHDELGALDRRLEQLIGKEQLQSLLSDKTPGVPVAPAEMHHAELAAEMDELRRLRAQREQ
jgi:hypothetical protein